MAIWYLKVSYICTIMQYLDDIISRSKIAEGSLETFDALYLRYFSLVEGFAFAMLKDKLAAQDVCQTVFMKLWEKRDDMREIESVSSYLFTMTRNEIFKIFNVRKSRGRSEELSTDLLKGLAVADVESVISSRDLLCLVAMTVESMPEQRRKVFNLSRIKGYTYPEIAAELGISVKTVEYHISRALTELKHILKVIVLFI